MTQPRYHHHCEARYKLRYRATLKVNGQTWDVWISYPTCSVVFRYGHEPGQYHSANFRELPLEAPRSISHATDIPVQTLNELWRQVRAAGLVF